jgi:hypothetical protein
VRNATDETFGHDPAVEDIHILANEYASDSFIEATTGRKSMPTKRREVPLEPRRVSPEEWEKLGLPLESLVISSGFGKPSKTPPAGGTPNSPSGVKPPEKD